MMHACVPFPQLDVRFPTSGVVCLVPANVTRGIVEKDASELITFNPVGIQPEISEPGYPENSDLIGNAH